MLGRREPKQPKRYLNYHFYLLNYKQSEDSTFVEEHCELLVLQPCPVPEEDDAAPAIPLTRICCCCASEWDSLSSCCTLTCGGDRVVKPVKKEKRVRVERRGTLSKQHKQQKTKSDTKHIRSQGYGAQKRHWSRSQLWLWVFIAHTWK